MALGLLWSSICLGLFFAVLVADKMGLLSKENKFPVKGRVGTLHTTMTVCVLTELHQAVLITGGSQGTGRCAARMLAEQGANIIIVARTVKRLEEAISYIAVPPTYSKSLCM